MRNRTLILMLIMFASGIGFGYYMTSINHKLDKDLAICQTKLDNLDIIGKVMPQRLMQGVK